MGILLSYLRFTQLVCHYDVDKTGGVCSEFEGMQKAAAAACFQPVSVHFPGGSKEIHEPTPRPPIMIDAGPRTEPETFRTRSKTGCADQQPSVAISCCCPYPSMLASVGNVGHTPPVTSPMNIKPQIPYGFFIRKCGEGGQFSVRRDENWQKIKKMKLNYSQKDKQQKRIGVCPVYIKIVWKLQQTPVRRTWELSGSTLTAHRQHCGSD